MATSVKHWVGWWSIRHDTRDAFPGFAVIPCCWVAWLFRCLFCDLFMDEWWKSLKNVSLMPQSYVICFLQLPVESIYHLHPLTVHTRHMSCLCFLGAKCYLCVAKWSQNQKNQWINNSTKFPVVSGAFSLKNSLFCRSRKLPIEILEKKKTWIPPTIKPPKTGQKRFSSGKIAWSFTFRNFVESTVA